MRTKKRAKSLTLKIVSVCSALLIIVLAFMTVGFAYYSQVLSVTGNVVVQGQSKIYISNVAQSSAKNVASSLTFTDNSIDFGMSLYSNPKVSDYQIDFSVTVVNQTLYDQYFSADWTPQGINKQGKPDNKVTIKYNLVGIKNGDKIAKGETITFTVHVVFTPPKNAAYTFDGDMMLEFSTSNNGTLMAEAMSLAKEDSGVLGAANFSIHVANLYNYSKDFSIILENDEEFVLTSNTGELLENITIPANSEADYAAQITVNGAQSFASSPEYVTVLLRSSDGDTVIGKIAVPVQTTTVAN